MGINTAIISPSGGSIGIGFSVPANTAKGVIDQLREYGETRRGWLGVKIQTITPEIAESLSLGNPEGALISDVVPTGPAEKAGIKAGDVITAIDGEAVDSPGDLARAINNKKEGDVTLTVIRNRSQQTFRVTPAEGGGFSGTTARPQLGRRIVIPRIQIPEIPEIDIEMPRIVTPRVRVPAVDIRMPRIRVTPRFRLMRGERGPI